MCIVYTTHFMYRSQCNKCKFNLQTYKQYCRMLRYVTLSRCFCSRFTCGCFESEPFYFRTSRLNATDANYTASESLWESKVKWRTLWHSWSIGAKMRRRPNDQVREKQSINPYASSMPTRWDRLLAQLGKRTRNQTKVFEKVQMVYRRRQLIIVLSSQMYRPNEPNSTYNNKSKSLFTMVNCLINFVAQFV